MGCSCKDGKLLRKRDACVEGKVLGMMSMFEGLREEPNCVTLELKV